MNRTKSVAWMAGAGLAMLLAGCGGGSSGNATIGGNVTGLAANQSLVLTNNGGDNLTVTGNGNPSISFTFAHSVGSQGAYNVKVATQPAGQTCSVSYGAGLVDFSGNAVTNVAVACSNNAVIGATVSGLQSSGQLVFSLMQNNDTKPSDLIQTTVTSTSSTNINYFSTGSGTVTLPLNSLYTVSVYAQPTNPAQVCSVDTSPGATPATGGVVSSNAITVNFICH